MIFSKNVINTVNYGHESISNSFRDQPLAVNCVKRVKFACSNLFTHFTFLCPALSRPGMKTRQTGRISCGGPEIREGVEGDEALQEKPADGFN